VLRRLGRRLYGGDAADGPAVCGARARTAAWPALTQGTSGRGASGRVGLGQRVPRVEGGVGRRAGADAEGGRRSSTARGRRDVWAHGALP
jgi:hypothetical protein